MNVPIEMSPEEFDQWLKQNENELMEKAERSALNYLAAEKAQAMAAEAARTTQPPAGS